MQSLGAEIKESSDGEGMYTDLEEIIPATGVLWKVADEAGIYIVLRISLFIYFLQSVSSYFHFMVLWKVTDEAGITKGLFILHYNINTDYYLLQLNACTAPLIHFIAVLQCSSRCRDGNAGTATQIQWSMNQP